MAHSGLNVLVLSDFNGHDANVVRDYLYCFNQHSNHNYFYLHAWSKNNFRRLQNFDFNRFDAVVLFWDFYWVGTEDPLSFCHVPDWVANRIAESRALKIQFLQDEYREIHLANRVMSRFGVNLMFSCVAKKDQEVFYPKARIPSLIATYPVLTGYVPSYLEKVNYPASIDRPIDIGYRSRPVPCYLGALGQEKHTIAARFQEIADRFGFTANISVREEDRIYGEDWLSFMKACRFSLGTESGASVVDFDGSIRKKCLEHLQQHPQTTFEEMRKRFFEEVDGKVVVQTISPRIFEASAFENTLVLHEGHYEGMLQPDVHFISVKKDYSNIAEVVERMKDRPFCERLARSAKEVLIDSKQYNYKSFVTQFDQILDNHVPARSRKLQVSRTLFYMMNYLNNDRLLPHGGVFLTIPHTCDIVYYYNKMVPYGIVLWYSFCFLLEFVGQAPKIIAEFIGRLLRDATEKRISILGVLKDLRILALFLQMRAGIFARHCPSFRLHLRFRSDTGQLIAKTLLGSHAGEAEALPQPTSHSDSERELVDSLLDGKTPFSILWDHAQLGNALPLPMGRSNEDSIFLNSDCVYRFESLNQLDCRLTKDEAAALKKLVFGGWQKSSWLRQCSALLFLTWIALQHLMYLIPMRHMKAMLARFHSKKNEQPAQQQEQKMAA